MPRKTAKLFDQDKDIFLATKFNWPTYQRYEIEDGWIVPYNNPGSDCASYPVFNYYLNTILDTDKTRKKDAAKAKLYNVLGYRTDGTSKFHLHTLFMSLDTTNEAEILGWCKEFGLPSHPIEMPWSKKVGYPLKKFIDEVHLMRFAWECFNALQTIDDAPILKVLLDNINFSLDQTNETSRISPEVLALYPSAIPDDVSPEALARYPSAIPDDALKQLIIDLPYETGQKAVKALIDAHIAGIVPEVKIVSRFDEPTSVSLSWKIDDLSSAMWMMFSNDLSGRRKIKKCAHQKCTAIFAADDSKMSYCSDVCKNRQKQADYRMREKLYEKLKRAFEAKNQLNIVIKDGDDTNDTVIVLDLLMSGKKRIIKFRSLTTDQEYQIPLDEIIDVQTL